jgi:hypothetical protein
MHSSANKLLQIIRIPRPFLVLSAIFASAVFVLFLLSLLALRTGASPLEVFYYLYLLSGFVLAAVGCVLAIAFVALPPYSKSSLYKGAAALVANGTLIALQIYFFMPH